MKKKPFIRLLTILLCLFMILPHAAAETRQGVIYLEGMEEAIEETLFESPEGFSFWYAHEGLQAEFGTAEGMDGVIVKNIYSDDYMLLSMISEAEAAEYAKNAGVDINAQSAVERAQIDVYQELKGQTIHFLSLIAEEGRYLRASGAYALEAAEGTAKYFQRILDSVAFGFDYDAELLKVLPGPWAEEYEGAKAALTMEENGTFSLSGTASDGNAHAWTGTWTYQSVPDSSSQLTLRFLNADQTSSLEYSYAAYTESWVENDAVITYLILTPMSEGGVSPFEEIFGEDGAALRREQGPNMRVANCREYVSLRAERNTGSKRLAQVPLGALVLAFPEAGEENGFISCVYQGQEGFILASYLEPIE